MTHFIKSHDKYDRAKNLPNISQIMATKVEFQQRKVLLYPGEDGYFVVEVPSLPGCISQGETR